MVFHMLLLVQLRMHPVYYKQQAQYLLLIAIIFEHLSRHLDPFYKNNRSFQIWAHVEWGQQEGIV